MRIEESIETSILWLVLSDDQHGARVLIEKMNLVELSAFIKTLDTLSHLILDDAKNRAANLITERGDK